MTPESLRRTLSTPGWRRSMLARRASAGLLVAVAVLLAVREAGTGDPRVLVFTRDVEAGQSVSRDDVAVAPVPAHLLPTTALTDPGEVDGRVVVAAAAAGEIATTARFIDSGAGAADVGQITHLVPVKLAEPEIIPLLHHGDTVTIVSHDSEGGKTQVIATGGRVILASAQQAPGTLLVALPDDAARDVAAASLGTPLAVVLTGDRATGS